MTSSSRKSMLLLGPLIVTGLVLLFALPFHYPPPIAWSEAYIFGYNNRLGEAIFIALALLVWLVGKARRISWPAATLPARGFDGAMDPRLDRELPWRLLAACLLVAALLCAFYAWLTYRAGGVNDGVYFLDRIHLIERGEVPYRDFEFVYGSFSLYASVFLGKVLRCGSTAGFYLLWAGETLLGVTLLWFAVRKLDLPATGKRVLFLLLFAVSLQLISGVTLNYCILRYSLPFLAVCLLPHLDRSPSLRARWGVGLATLAAVVMLLGLSPEEGIALAVAFLLYLPLRRWSLGRPWLPDVAVLAGTLFVVYRLAAHRGVFGTMGRFGAGAFNLPLLPGLPLLFFIAAFLLVVLLHASGRIRDRAPSNLALALIYGFGMLPGALGRADSIHLLGYELPLMATALLLTRFRPALWRTSVVVCALSFLVLPVLEGWNLGQPTLGKALLLHLYADGRPSSRLGRWADAYVTRKTARDLGADAARQKMSEIQAVAEGKRLEPSLLFAGISPIVMTPFQYLPNKLSLYQSPAIDEGYYMGLSNITDPAQIQEKIAELRRYPERDLLVSNEGLLQCQVHSSNAGMMEHLLLAPFVPEPRNLVYTFVPVCSYLRDNYQWLYRPADTTYGYGVMRHN